MKYPRTFLMVGFLIASSYFAGSLVSSLSSSNESIDDQTKRAIELSMSKEDAKYKAYFPLEMHYPYIYDPSKPSFTIHTDTFYVDSPVEKLSLDSLLKLDSITKDIEQRKTSFNAFYRKISPGNYFRSYTKDNF